MHDMLALRERYIMYLESLDSEQSLKNLETFENKVADHIPYRHSVLLNYKLGTDAIHYLQRSIQLINNHKVGIVPKGTITNLKKNINRIQNDRNHHCYYLYTNNTKHHDWEPTVYMTVQDFVNIAEAKL